MYPVVLCCAYICVYADVCACQYADMCTCAHWSEDNPGCHFSGAAHLIF